VVVDGALGKGSLPRVGHLRTVNVVKHLDGGLALRGHVHVLRDCAVGTRHRLDVEHTPIVAVRVHDRVELATDVIEHLERGLLARALVVVVHLRDVLLRGALLVHERSEEALERRSLKLVHLVENSLAVEHLARDDNGEKANRRQRSRDSCHRVAGLTPGRHRLGFRLLHRTVPSLGHC